MRIVTVFKPLGGYSRAALVECDDNRRYVVKGLQVGRTLIADQVMGRLGAVVGAPVANVALIEVPQTLIDARFTLMHFAPGIGHGAAFIEGCYDGWGVEHADEPANRDRYAMLALLYGLAMADDHQFLYEKQAPHRVYSVDHGHFFAGAPEWTAEDLRSAPTAVPDELIIQSVALGSEALHNAALALSRVTDSEIALAVAIPPDSWGMLIEERSALAQYIAKRRDELLAFLSSTT